MWEAYSQCKKSALTVCKPFKLVRRRKASPGRRPRKLSEADSFCREKPSRGVRFQGERLPVRQRKASRSTFGTGRLFSPDHTGNAFAVRSCEQGFDAVKRHWERWGEESLSEERGSSPSPICSACYFRLIICSGARMSSSFSRLRRLRARTRSRTEPPVSSASLAMAADVSYPR